MASGGWAQTCLDVDVEFQWSVEAGPYPVLAGCDQGAWNLTATLVPLGSVAIEWTYTGVAETQLEQAVLKWTTTDGCFLFFHPAISELDMLGWNVCEGCETSHFDILDANGDEGVLRADVESLFPEVEITAGEWSIELEAWQEPIQWSSMKVNFLEAACGGCTYTVACNYDSLSIVDDGSCDFESCYGCMQSNACNYDENATQDDGSCELPPCNGIGSPPGLELVPVNNPFYSLSYVAEDRSPILASYSGWFDVGRVDVGVYNALSAVAHVDVVIHGSGESIVHSILPIQGMAYELIEGLGLPEGMTAHDIWRIELKHALTGEILDELGSLDSPLSEVEIADIPRAPGQHNLVRQAWVLKGNSLESAASTWTVVEENETVNFATAWNLNESIEVAYYTGTEDCWDNNGDGICDQLELPITCENVNATNYSPSDLVLLCQEAETLEFWESSCCDEDGGTTSLAGMPPPNGNGNNLVTTDFPCGTSASKLSFCNAGQRAFVLDEANQRVRILDYGDLNQPSAEIGGELLQIDAPFGSLQPVGLDVWNVMLPDSIICCSTMVAVAWVDTTVVNHPGYVGFYGTSGELLDPTLGLVEAGFGTRGVSFSPDGTWLVAANSGEATAGGGDPVASVTCVDVSSYTQSPTAGSLEGLDVYQVSFESISAIAGEEARMAYANSEATPAQILEPNAVSFTPDSKRAWITCTVNNSWVELDMEALDMGGDPVLGAFGMGTRDMASGRGFDGKNNGLSALEVPSFACRGWRQPREVEIVQAGSKMLLVAANEGQPRLLSDGSEEVILFDSTEESEYNGLQIDPAYGYGLTGDGMDAVYVYGSRSFSIWDVTLPGVGPQLLYDSGSMLEETLSSLLPGYANSLSDANGTHDWASVARGPEPSAVAFGEIQDKAHVFVSLEQMGGAMVFVMSNWGLPSVEAFFQGYASNRNFTDQESEVCDLGDLGAADVLFLPKAITNYDDLSGVAENMDAIAIANQVSGTVSVFSMTSTLEVPGCTQSCACNYNAAASQDDGSCEYATCVSEGCTYEGATNYSAAANFDDGSCLFDESCEADLNGSGQVDSADLLNFLTQYGLECD